MVNCEYSGYDVYIGRPSKWGNPFVVGKDGTREEVIGKYKKWIKNQAHLTTSLSEHRAKKESNRKETKVGGGL